MNELPVTPEPGQPRRSNTGIIIAVVVVVLLCCCCVTLGLLWQYGDLIFQGTTF